MFLSKKCLTESSLATSYIVHLKHTKNQVQARRINLFNEKSKLPTGCNPTTQLSMSWSHSFLVLHHKEKVPEQKTPKKSSGNAVLFPWFSPLLFKAFPSWEVAGCKVFNSVGVRHDTLSKTSTINHLNQADIFRLIKPLKVTLSEFQYCTVSGKWLWVFATISGILNTLYLKIPSPAFISCSDLIKLTGEESGHSKLQNDISA